jgi:hypothetical protein
MLLKMGCNFGIVSLKRADAYGGKGLVKNVSPGRHLHKNFLGVLRNLISSGDHLAKVHQKYIFSGVSVP